MEDNFDFSSATADDFVKGSDVKVETPAVESAPIQEPIAPVSAPESSLPEAAPEPEAKPKAEYNFKDDFIKGVVEFYEKTGDITPYLAAKTTDFTKMSDEDVLRRSLREQYSELSDKSFDKLYKMEVTDKFKLDEDEWSEDETQLGRELLKIEANKSRATYLDWQKNFSAPEQVADNSQREEAEKMMKQFETQVKSSQLTQKLVSEKKISIKTSDGEFNFELQSPDSLIDMTLDNDKFFSQFAGQNGEIDYDRWYKTAAYSQNPEVFEKSLINYGKSLGRMEITKEIKNPTGNGSGDTPTETSGDFTSGLLQAFAARGVKK